MDVETVSLLASMQVYFKRANCSTKCHTLPTTGASRPAPMLLTLLTFHELHNTYCRNLVRSVASYFTAHTVSMSNGVHSPRTTCFNLD